VNFSSTIRPTPSFSFTALVNSPIFKELNNLSLTNLFIQIGKIMTEYNKKDAECIKT